MLSLLFLLGYDNSQCIFWAVNIFLSITVFLGNSFLLVALNKEFLFHPPFKLLYRRLATSTLFVGLVSQPLHATCYMSLVHEHWNLCRYSRGVVFISSFALCSVSSRLMLTAIGVDRLLALFLGIRQRQIATLKRSCIVTATFWILPIAAGSFSISHT